MRTYVFAGLRDLRVRTLSVRLVGLWLLRAAAAVALATATFSLSPFARSVDDLPTRDAGRVLTLVVDRSGSMERDDLELDGVRRSRLTVAVELSIEALALADGSRKNPSSDLAIGLVSFAGRSRIDATPTRAHDRIAQMLRQLEPTRRLRDDGTAIADAIIAAAGDPLERSIPSEAPSRALLILTDGQQNAGQFSLDDAIAALKAAAVRPFVIQIRPSRFGSIAYEQDRAEEFGSDLQELCDQTDGMFFVASESDALRDVLADAETLTTQQIPDERPPVVTDWAVAPFDAAGRRWPPLLLLSAGILGLCEVLRATVLRVLP